MRDEPDLLVCAKYLKALADSDRLRLVQHLRSGEKTVGELSEFLGAPLANVSHHLVLLKRAGVVVARKQGRFVIYGLSPAIYQAAGNSRSPRVLDFGHFRIDLDGPSVSTNAPQSATGLALSSQETLRQINHLLERLNAGIVPARPSTKSPAGRRRPSQTTGRAIAIENPSFELPATKFFETAVAGWVKEGDPSGTGVFFNAPDDAPFRGSRLVINADGNQLAAIAARNPGGRVGPPGLAQAVKGARFEVGATYALTVAVGVSSVQPPTGPAKSHPPALRVALTYTDDADVRHELAGVSVEAGDGLTPTRLTSVSVRVTVPRSGGGSGGAGRPIGVRITSAPNGPEHDGHFICDDVRLTLNPLRRRSPKRGG